MTTREDECEREED
jgi:hypothetical protein